MVNHTVINIWLDVSKCIKQTNKPFDSIQGVYFDEINSFT